ncbi:peptidase S8, partial [Streptomyces sp. NRRL F-6602]
CYTFDQLRTVYGVKELKATGKGQTVAVVMPVGSPVLETDLRAFSEKLRLAAPQIEVVRHAPDSGEAAPFDWDSDVMVSQAKDTTLAVQAVHAMAPEAKVVLHQVDAAPGEADEG